MILALVLSLTLRPTVTVDRLEINTYCDAAGNICWQQAIYWDWCDASASYHVRDWRMMTRAPSIDTRGEYLRETFCDLTIQIRQPITHTVTQHDPERDDRQAYPAELRRTIFRDCHRSP